MIFRYRLGLYAGVVALLTPALAHADPITLSTAIVTYLGVSGVAATVSTFVLTAAIGLSESFALSAVGQALFGPKLSSATSQDRQADVLNLNIGEVPRELLFGRAATAGSLSDEGFYG